MRLKYLILVLGVVAVIHTGCAAPPHGGGGGQKYFVNCPNGGVITGVTIRAGDVVDQIGFVCTSFYGVTFFGPFGSDGGTLYNTHCPQGQYISSIYGKSGQYLDQIGIRCRHGNDMTGPGVPVGQWGGSGGSSFDDGPYSFGFRPVEISIGAGGQVDSIQIRYDSTPVTIPSK